MENLLLFVTTLSRRKVPGCSTCLRTCELKKMLSSYNFIFGQELHSQWMFKCLFLPWWIDCCNFMCCIRLIDILINFISLYIYEGYKRKKTWSFYGPAQFWKKCAITDMGVQYCDIHVIAIFLKYRKKCFSTSTLVLSFWYIVQSCNLLMCNLNILTTYFSFALVFLKVSDNFQS